MGKAELSLCWDCRCSVEKLCPWAKRFQPVKGWNAKETENGYLVRECPMFDRDSYEFGLIRDKKEWLRREENREKARLKAEKKRLQKGE